MKENVRRLIVDLKEDMRECACCKKCLQAITDTVIITAPKSGVVYEYCSWYCLFTNVKSLLGKKLISAKIDRINLLAKLKYDDNEKRINQRLKD